jgi:hypothetical protein
MNSIAQYPAAILVAAFVAFWLSTRIGAWLKRRQPTLGDDFREDFNVVQAAVLTLLGLVIGFTLSMAVSRYDQRKADEEGEANAIGTEYLRADLLPAADAARVRTLLKSYLDQRVLFYSVRDGAQLVQANTRSARLQNELWAAVRTAAAAQPTPLSALAVNGMNDVLNSQGYSQAARSNGIPAAVWLLMTAIALFGNLLMGFGARDAKAARILLVILPAVVALAFFLIADIDSPSTGVIRVAPDNLLGLAASLQAP